MKEIFGFIVLHNTSATFFIVSMMSIWSALEKGGMHSNGAANLNFILAVIFLTATAITNKLENITINQAKIMRHLGINDDGKF